MYDTSFADLESLETEIIKIASYYINKVEPLIDRDLINIYPTVDRLQIQDDLIALERKFYFAKYNLV
jgi:hypothetical protein